MPEPLIPQNKNTWQIVAVKSLWTFLTIAAAILFYYIIQYLGQISSFIGSVFSALSPIFWGLVIAYLLDPVAGFYERTVHGLLSEHGVSEEKNAKLSRVLSAFLMLFSAIGFIALLVWLIVPQVSTSMKGLAEELPLQIDAMMLQLQTKTVFDNNTAFGAYANDTLVEALESFESWIKSGLPSQAETMLGRWGCPGSKCRTPRPR